MHKELNELLEKYRKSIQDRDTLMNNPCTSGDVYEKSY
jgi:hypothetical protein